MALAPGSLLKWPASLAGNIIAAVAEVAPLADGGFSIRMSRADRLEAILEADRGGNLRRASEEASLILGRLVSAHQSLLRLLPDAFPTGKVEDLLQDLSQGRGGL